VLIARIGCRLAKALQEIGEYRMRMQWHVAEDVVEDVRLWDVIERSRWTDGHRRREAASRERLEEQLGLQESLHRDSPPAGLRFKACIHLIEVRDAIGLQSDDFDPLEEGAGCVLLKVLHAAVVKRLPDAMVFLRVSRPILTDVEGLKAQFDLFTMAVLMTLHFRLQKRKRPVIFITGRVS
jgi:hypothetical protein